MLQLKSTTTNAQPLWLVESLYRIGSSSQSDIRIQELEDVKATLQVEGDSAKIMADQSNDQIKLNDSVFSGEKSLTHGDRLTLGRETYTLLDPKKLQVEINSGPTLQTVELCWCLEPMNHALSSMSFPLSGRMIIGRSKSCDISLGVAHLSRQHASLEVSAGGLYVEDLQSANGTCVNGARVTRAQLKDGDELSFDALCFRVVGPDLNDTLDIDKTTVRPAVISALNPAVNPCESTAIKKPVKLALDSSLPAPSKKTSRPAKKDELGSSDKLFSVGDEYERDDYESSSKVGLTLVFVVLILLGAAGYAYVSGVI